MINKQINCNSHSLPSLLLFPSISSNRRFIIMLFQVLQKSCAKSMPRLIYSPKKINVLLWKDCRLIRWKNRLVQRVDFIKKGILLNKREDQRYIWCPSNLHQQSYTYWKLFPLANSVFTKQFLLWFPFSLYLTLQTISIYRQ